jgi:hypothetical protein
LGIADSAVAAFGDAEFDRQTEGDAPGTSSCSLHLGFTFLIATAVRIDGFHGRFTQGFPR